MNWFRVYHDIIDDPKILALPRTYRWHVVELLAISSRQTERGTLPDENEIGIHLRLNKTKTQKVIQVLTRRGFIDVSSNGSRLKIHGWEKRQFKSDDVSVRSSASMKRSRERSHGVHVNVPDTDTDTDTEKTPPKPPPDSRQKGKAPAVILDLPDWLPAEEWNGFVEMRRGTKPALTEYAKKLAIAKLGRMREEGHNPKEVLQAAIIGCWKGLYVPSDRNGKPETNGQHPKPILTEADLKVREEQSAKSRAEWKERERRALEEREARKVAADAARSSRVS